MAKPLGDRDDALAGGQQDGCAAITKIVGRRTGGEPSSSHQAVAKIAGWKSPVRRPARIYLGMRVRKPRGVLRVLGLGPQIRRSWKEQPDGLLLHEDLVWSLVPPHLGMRQYWRDLDSLERWTRSEPHRRWWQQFLTDSGGTGFWHESYFMRGGVDAIYDDMTKPTGLGRFALSRPARGAMFSARGRAGGDEPVVAPAVPEQAYYDGAAAGEPSAGIVG